MSEQRVNSFERKPGIESGNIDLPKLPEIKASETTAKGVNVLGKGGVEIDTEQVMRADDLDHEAFMRQLVEIHLSEAGDENEPQFFEGNVNGDYKMMVRGEAGHLRRYHLEVMANAKQIRVQQKKVVNNDGSMGFIEVPMLKQTYPFAVLHDPAGKRGSDWLRQLLRNQG